MSHFSNKIVTKRESKSSLRCPCSIPEDVPIDLRIIATGIKVAPYCGVIYAALQPRGEVFEVAAFLAQVLGEIFCAIVLALVAFLEIFERAIIPIGKIRFVCFALLCAYHFFFAEQEFAQFKKILYFCRLLRLSGF